jgi:AcrR family transcriptional regulator
MPRIATQTLAQHRDWRRGQLIDAAASIAMQSGGHAVTVAAVAQRAGLSRTSVYEYFASSADLVADLVIDELNGFAHYLNDEIAQANSPSECVELWIKGALTYIADGRHLLAKALNATTLPQERAHQIKVAHRGLLAPLMDSLEKLQVEDLQQALAFIQAVTDASTKRIEAGNNPEKEIEKATAFCLNGLNSI